MKFFNKKIKIFSIKGILANVIGLPLVYSGELVIGGGGFVFMGFLKVFLGLI